MQVAHKHKIPLIVDNTFGMGGMSRLCFFQEALMRNCCQVI